MSRKAKKRRKLLRVLAALRRTYDSVPPPRRGPDAGLDALVEAMLAQNTNWANAMRGYRMLRRRFDSWTKVMNAPVADVQREGAVCGLARMRARRLQDLLRRIKAEWGRLSLAFLAAEPTAAAFDYLLTFHGVGPKTAAFTLLFGFGHPLLPVDNRRPPRRPPVAVGAGQGPRPGGRADAVAAAGRRVASFGPR